MQSLAVQMLLKLVRYLHSRGVTPEVFGTVFNNELWLNSPNPLKKTSLKIWLDHMDYGPLVNGIPEMHYRIQIRGPESKLSSDARSSSIAELERIIYEAFGLDT